MNNSLSEQLNNVRPQIQGDVTTSLITLLNVMDDSEDVKRYLSLKRLKLFEHIHQIVFYGKGGYDFDTVYNLPIWLRHFIYKKLEEHYEREAEAVEDAKAGKSPATKPKNIRKPDFIIKRPSE